MPEQCYGGSYVADIAQSIIDKDGRKYEQLSDQERMEAFREIAYQMMLDLQHEVMSRMGTEFDCWFSERSLYVEDETGESPVSRSLKAMEDKGYVKEEDGAIWFRSSALGDEKDRVMIKACLLYTSPSPRDVEESRIPSSA